MLEPKAEVPNAIGYDDELRLFVRITREELHVSAGLGKRQIVKRESLE
jgi:hypothetical protein